MSWNTPSSGGFQAMAPSEAQPSMSHEQLLSNRDALERKLSQRRPRQELVSIGIMPAVSAAPAILSQRTKLERAKTGDILQKKIRARPNRAQLIQKHILYETPGAVDPSLVDKQMRLKRKKLEDNLNDKLLFRPGPLELVKQNILEAGTEMSHAVQEGTVPFTETTSNYREPISPESVDSPEPSPDPSNIASPPSVASLHSFASSPGSTCITSTVQALASLQAQTRKHSLEQQEQQQQQHQMFLQQQNGQQQVLPSQLPVSSTGTKKEARSRKKTAKPKVKKYKYHEYRPPNGEVQKSELPSDSPYGLLLQQQQLYLQLQVLFQNYPHHCMLPSIPENAKVSSNGGKNNNSNAEKPVKIEEMRVVDMRRALKERGLPVFGSKTDLIKRLQEIGAFPPPEPNASTTISLPVVSTQAQVTTSAPSSSSAQALPTNVVHPPLHRSNSLPLQSPNLNTVQQLQMQILANNQSLQQLKVPPEVQQQLQQLKYLNLQLQLQHLNIQQQQNIQPKPMDTPVTCQTASVKTESLTNNTCTFQGSPVNQSQTLEQKPVPFAVKQECQTVQMSPRNPHQQQLAQTQTQVKQQQVDQVNQALVHLQEQAQSLDSIDSNPSSVDSQVLSWDQQHPLFDGESESYPSPGSQLSDMSNLSPLPADSLSRSMDSLQSSSVFHGNAKPDNHLIPGSYPERSSDEYLSMVPQRKPRSLSEPQFPVSTHRRTSSFPSIPFATPPPSYEAAVAAQSQKQFQNVSFGSQMAGGFPIMNSVSPKQDDMDLHLDSVIQDKELSQELQKAMMKNFASLNHDDILEILGEPCSQFPTTTVTNSFAGIMTPSLTTSGNQPPMSKSPSYGSYLSQRFVPPSQNSPGRMSRSCDDVSQLSVNNKFPFQAENGAMYDFDNFLTSPLSPMKIDSCDTDDSPGLLFNSSNSIPIPSSNGIVGKTDTLSWLDLSMLPTAQQNVPHANVELTSIHNNNHKGTPPLNLYGDHEHTPLSLFDLETPTALHPPSDFGEAMDYCI